MHLLRVSGLFTGLAGAAALVSDPDLNIGQALSRKNCRCLPSDDCWPSTKLWNGLNRTVDGRLAATVPIGSPCHDPNYDATLCAALQANWLESKTHLHSPSSIMQISFANQSCDPFTPREQPCVLGNYVSHTVDARTVDDVVASVDFARKNNLRFNVRNTGHDVLGRSTGAGALSVWTQHLKSVEVIKDYQSFHYSGQAVRIGAGMQGWEIAEALTPHGIVAVTGECPSVGAVGGFTQGGGHSTLSTSYGLGADQTLEFEVVTAAGKVVTASRNQNEDLYAALSGGGGGSYGVVTSMTVRAHPVEHIGGGSISFQANATTVEKYEELLLQLHELIPAMVDHGATLIYIISAEGFSISPFTVVNATGDFIRDTVAAPFLKAVKKAGITPATQFSTLSYRDHLDTYLGPLPYGNLATAQYQGAGRMIGRKDIKSNVKAVSSALSNLVSNGVLLIGTVGKFTAPHGVKNHVYPRWRDAIASVATLTPWNEDPAAWEEMSEDRKRFTDEFIPRMKAATPHGGSYMNEANFQEANWKHEFFGENYPKLLTIKNKWDPEHLFYGLKLVGSDTWNVDDHGRMCRSFL